MIIESIALRHFRSAKGLVLDTAAPRVYICGRNGVGKTNIKEAVRWALRGVTSETDARGLGWEMLQPEGTTAVAVGVKIGRLSVERGYQGKNKELLVNDSPAEITTSQEAIYQTLQVAPAFIDAVLETSYFVDLSHGDAKAFVLGLLNVQIDVDLMPLTLTTPDKKFQKMTLDQVESRYKLEYQKRTQVKAARAAHHVPTFTEPEGEMPQVEAVVQKVADLRKELKELVATSGNVRGQRVALEQELARAEAIRVVLPGSAPSEEEVATLKATVEAAERDLEAAITDLAARPPAPKKAKKGDGPEVIPISLLEKTADLLTKHKPAQGCVMDGNVRCETAKIVFTNRVKAIRADIDSRAELVELGDETVEAPADPLAELRATIAKVKAQYEAGVQAINMNLSVAETNRQWYATIASVTERLNALDEDPAVQESIAALETRISKGEMFETRCRNYWKEKDTYQKAVARAQELDQAVAQSEALVEQLGPKGAMVVALRAAIGAFEERINLTTERFGWTVRFDLDPWRVWVNKRTLESYSESQRFRIGVAVQMAVSALSGLGFVVVDRLDMLDTQYRAAMTQMLLDAVKVDVQQVIILATRDDDLALPVVGGMKAYRLGLNDAQETYVVEEGL